MQRACKQDLLADTPDKQKKWRNTKTTSRSNHARSAFSFWFMCRRFVEELLDATERGQEVALLTTVTLLGMKRKCADDPRELLFLHSVVDELVYYCFLW